MEALALGQQQVLLLVLLKDQETSTCLLESERLQTGRGASGCVMGAQHSRPLQLCHYESVVAICRKALLAYAGRAALCPARGCLLLWRRAGAG